MTVYVDEMRQFARENIKPAARRYGTVWCHMTADTVAELKSFACRLGMNPNWIQDEKGRHPHFDLTPAKRREALALGARAVSAIERMKIKLRDEALAAGGCGTCFCKPSFRHTFCRCACHTVSQITPAEGLTL